MTCYTASRKSLQLLSLVTLSRFLPFRCGNPLGNFWERSGRGPADPGRAISRMRLLVLQSMAALTAWHCGKILATGFCTVLLVRSNSGSIRISSGCATFQPAHSNALASGNFGPLSISKKTGNSGPLSSVVHCSDHCSIKERTCNWNSSRAPWASAVSGFSSGETSLRCSQAFCRFLHLDPT